VEPADKLDIHYSEGRTASRNWPETQRVWEVLGELKGFDYRKDVLAPHGIAFKTLQEMRDSTKENTSG
jgi:hypothetical protein